MSDFEPRIVGFLCNWCSYAGADLAGVSRFQYPPNLRIIRVMCSGRVHPAHIMEAFKDGADGVLVAGCHPPNDCHYISGNLKAKRRVAMLKQVLKQLGLEEERLHLEWVSAAEGDKFAKMVQDFTAELKAMGPSPLGHGEIPVEAD
jgi:F420-non-reducing hydrogenase iron-sulfur subunit